MVSDRLGYVSASVPTDRVDSLAASASILAVDLNESIPLPKPETAQAGTTPSAAVAGPGATTPDDNPYMPTRDTGSVAFKAAHNTWDGRGITIGVLDSGVDLDHPALQTTSTGERKIVDWVTATHPLLEGDGSWRAMLDHGHGPDLRVRRLDLDRPRGHLQDQPALREHLAERRGGRRLQPRRRHDGQVGSPLRRDDPRHLGRREPGPDLLASREDAALQGELRRRALRHGQPGDRDLRVRCRSSSSTARTWTPRRPACRAQADFVNIGVVEAAHGTHVAGIAAGHSLFGGAMDGQAPGAKIVSSRACSWGGGCTAVALTDGMVDLVVNRGVDVVNMSIGGLPALNDGNNARARLYDTLINDEGVQLVISAGNSGPGINTIGDPSVATDVISVASSITRETWLANYGAEVTSALTLHNYSSRGPREDGGFKPNVMAPGSAISSIPTWQPGGPVPEAGYSLPPGYAMFNGTSMASPQTAGGVALLLSAAKADGTTVTPRQLRDSLYTSADFVRGVEAIGQGAGQVDIPGAWDLLKTRPTSQDYTATRAGLHADLGLPGHPRPGHRRLQPLRRRTRRPGLRGQERTTRSRSPAPGGPAGHVRAQPSPRGQRRHLLGAGQDRSAAARQGHAGHGLGADRAAPGAHSAILEIDDPATSVVDHRVLVTVVLSQDLVAPTYTQSKTDSVERNLTKKLFVTVPEGAKALQVNLSGVAAGSQVRWIANNPYGVPVESDLLGGVLHELQRPVLQQHLACVREPAARGLGARDRGAAHDAHPGQPVHRSPRPPRA